MKTVDNIGAYMDKIRFEKLHIAQSYQKLLYMTLDDCLIKFCRKDVEPYLRNYLEGCITVLFFRVPRFQKLVLKCLAEKERFFERIEEWRNVTWDINENTYIQHHVSVPDSPFLSASPPQKASPCGFIKLIDWSSHFYQYLSSPTQQLSS